MTAFLLTIRELQNFAENCRFPLVKSLTFETRSDVSKSMISQFLSPARLPIGVKSPLDRTKQQQIEPFYDRSSAAQSSKTRPRVSASRLCGNVTTTSRGKNPLNVVPDTIWWGCWF